MWNEILEYLGRHTAQKLTWRRILTEAALTLALVATASWLSR
jgi:hypothetical protein